MSGNVKFPHKPGDRIDLNGRIYKIAYILRQDVVLSYLPGEQSGAPLQEPIFLNQEFEWKGWAFRVVKILKNLIYVRPFAVRRELAEAASAEANTDQPKTPQGFVIDSQGGELPGIENLEEFVQKILESLEPPETASDELRGAWATGVQAYFEGKKENASPWNDSPIVRLDEAEDARQRRIAYGTYWKLGWASAYSKTLLAYGRLRKESI